MQLISFFAFSLSLLVLANGTFGASFFSSRKGNSTAAVLRVGVDPRVPPLVFLRNNQVVGLEADMATRFAESQNLQVEFVQLAGNELLKGLEDGRCDIVMSGVSATQLRASRVDFTQFYLTISQQPLAHRRSVALFATLPGVVNTQEKVGVIEGFQGDLLLQSRFLFAQRVPYTDITAAANDLIAGKIAMIIADSPVVWWLSSEYEMQGLVRLNLNLTQEYVCWAVRKGDSERLQAANQFLRQATESGLYAELINRWLPSAIPPPAEAPAAGSR